MDIIGNAFGECAGIKSARDYTINKTWLEMH